MTGLVTKKQANSFCVDFNGNTFVCTAQKKLKENGIFVGDHVQFDADLKQIIRVLPRKNKLLRPPLANLDTLIILVSSQPAPDFLLLDKMLLFCAKSGITPIICHSKTDLGTTHLKYLNSAYASHFKVVDISVANKCGINNLQKLLVGKVCALAGQSGVGKSALINALVGENQAQVGELSAKILRGKNTTRHAQLFALANNTFLADTAGFSSLDEKFLGINAQDIASFYPEFLALAPHCKFKPCTHTHEPNCAVKLALENGKIEKMRYARYLTIYENLK